MDPFIHSASTIVTQCASARCPCLSSYTASPLGHRAGLVSSLRDAAYQSGAPRLHSRATRVPHIFDASLVRLRYKRDEGVSILKFTRRARWRRMGVRITEFPKASNLTSSMTSACDTIHECALEGQRGRPVTTFHMTSLSLPTSSIIVNSEPDTSEDVFVAKRLEQSCLALFSARGIVAH